MGADVVVVAASDFATLTATFAVRVESAHIGPIPKASCTDHTPSWFVGHWRDWHRGHGCDQDDGKPRRAAAVTEIDQHAANAATGFLTDADLSFLRTSTTSGNTLLVRAIDELIKRRAAAKEAAR
jgi:hypothetical protein